MSDKQGSVSLTEDEWGIIIGIISKELIESFHCPCGACHVRATALEHITVNKMGPQLQKLFPGSFLSATMDQNGNIQLDNETSVQ